MNGLQDPRELRSRLEQRTHERDQAWVDKLEAEVSTDPAVKKKDLEAAQAKWEDLDRKVKVLSSKLKEVEG